MPNPCPCPYPNPYARPYPCPIGGFGRTYPKTSHGFSVRGNSADPHISTMRKEALDDSIAFLRAHL